MSAGALCVLIWLAGVGGGLAALGYHEEEWDGDPAYLAIAFGWPLVGLVALAALPFVLCFQVGRHLRKHRKVRHG